MSDVGCPMRPLPTSSQNRSPQLNNSPVHRFPSNCYLCKVSIGKKNIESQVNEPDLELYQSNDITIISKILDLTRKLSPEAMEQLAKKIQNIHGLSKSKSQSEFSDFLLSGPVMEDSHWKAFQDHREQLNQWRLKSFT